MPPLHTLFSNTYKGGREAVKNIDCFVLLAQKWRLCIQKHKKGSKLLPLPLNTSPIVKY